MLRQVHIFHKAKNIFSHSYALALSDEELSNIIKIIKSHLESPLPGKTFQKPFTNFQIFHRSYGNTLFLFIVDLIDNIDYMDAIIKKTIHRFNELFPHPEAIIDSEIKKGEFIGFLKTLHSELHSKITIIGPEGSGKTTLYDMLKSDSEKTIMNFAKSSQFYIDGLTFDLWDFQLNDNFSLLWSKFVSGSDLVLLLFDLSNYHVRVIDHFRSLYGKESSLSKLLILGNKSDLIKETDLKIIKNELELDELESISLQDLNAKELIVRLISRVLGIKKNLPPSFKIILTEAKDYEAAGNSVLAIAKYKELVKLCNEYQDFTQIQNFKDRIAELQGKIDQQNELRRIRESKKKFEVPEKIRFTDKIAVKPLPSEKEQIKQDIQSMVSFAPLKKVEVPKKPVKETVPKIGGLTLFDSEEIKETREKKKSLEPSDIKIDLKVIEPIKERDQEVLEITASDSANELQKLIEAKGSSLSLKLCKELIRELQKALSRPITHDDIEMAADVFVKQESI